MERIWERHTDRGAVHCMGNGRVCAYAQGLDLIQIFGEPYSAGTFCSVTAEGIDSAHIQRLPGTDIWRYRLADGSEITDFADSGSRCFLRRIRAVGPLHFVLRVRDSFSPQGSGRAFVSKPGESLFYIYPSPITLHNAFAVSGSMTVERKDERIFHLTAEPGEAVLCVSVTEKEAESGCREVLSAQERTAAVWKKKLAQLCVPDELHETAESVAVLILAQQGEDGGVLAGYNYHLAYVRDQYGTARGLLAMGLTDAAERILQYYAAVFRERGAIHNAQSIGNHSVFHIHENDGAEITGYLVHLACLVFRKTGNRALLEELRPMLQWAMRAQQALLADGMLPFNGDETYIAGGFLPRSCMYHGSAEATMLFVESAALYAACTGETEFMPAAEQAAALYRKNFLSGGTLQTNNPLRGGERPARRHGVCESCNAFGDVFRNENGRYLCPACLSAIPPLPAGGQTVYCLSSVAFAPVYIGSALIPRETLLQMVAAGRQAVLSTLSDNSKGEVGYTYGMLLYALHELQDPGEKELFRIVASLPDETGAYCEYYCGGKPYNTRCRPWESGINIEALLRCTQK